MLYVITDKTFEKEVEESHKPVFIDFWSEYCSPCKVQMPIVEELAKEYKGKVKFGKFEVGANPDIPAKYGIMGVPALAVFHKGKLTQIRMGLQQKEFLKNMIEIAVATL